MKKLAFSLIVATAGMMAISANAMSPKNRTIHLPRR